MFFDVPLVIVVAALQALGSGPLHGAAQTARHGSRLHNSFCPVPTFVNRNIGSQGLALIEPNGREVIYIGQEEAVGDRAYRDFLMAHECCHHTRGHLRRLRDLDRESALLALSFVSRGVELDADCCAGAALAKAGRIDAVREAARRMRSFGAMPTGAEGYPSGDVRAMLIEDCAASGASSSEPVDASGPAK
jgi:hypothetical protein